MHTKFNFSFLLLALALGGHATACSSDAGAPDSGAQLTILGESTILVQPGFERTLAVAYTDSAGNPLFGDLAFSIEGIALDSVLGNTNMVTDAEGEVEAVLQAGAEETSFRVVANAPYADAVEWIVEVKKGAVSADMDIRGRYSIDSHFDVLSALPVRVGLAANTLADMSDGPHDPASFVLDKILEDQDSFVANAVSALRPSIDEVINNEITSRVPDTLNDLLALGNDLSQVGRNFGISSEMEVAGDQVELGSWRAKQEVLGFKFVLDGLNYEFSLAEMYADRVVVEDIGISYHRQSGTLQIAQHSLPVEYGGFLVKALEDVIVPRLDSNAESLVEFIENRIDCRSIAVTLYERADFLSESFYEGACQAAIVGVASEILDRLREIDDSARVQIVVSGKALLGDRDGDGWADLIREGQWTGVMDYLGDIGVLRDGANGFSGSRVN